VADSAEVPFLIRHEFLIRRLHSLTGIVPLGAYMCVHLLTNASLLNGVPTFQRAVFQIHSLGRLLPLVEWGFIFTPLLFHGLLGVWIARTGRVNVGSYPYAANRRYTWQRWTGLIALVFLLTHVFHLHGWFHFHGWLESIAEPLGMARFRPYNAASTLAHALDGVVWPMFYAVGVLACVYHLANGLWTAGITWGLWVSPAAQRRASQVCGLFGVVLAIVGMSALAGAMRTDPIAAQQIENQMYRAGVESGLVPHLPEKRTQPDPVDVMAPGGEQGAPAVATPDAS
jgi:succinate dehydrogenase / fumarate reductase cytochrome b subunit